METVYKQKKINIASINNKSILLDLIYSELATSRIEVLFKSENIKNGLLQLSALKELPKVCIVDLDFGKEKVLTQLQELRKKYPEIKLIIYSDNSNEKVIKALLEIGIDGHLFIGSDMDDFKKAIEGAIEGQKYFSLVASVTARKYYTTA